MAFEIAKDTPDTPLRQFENQKTVSLETRKRNGTWVATPANIVVEGRHAAALLAQKYPVIHRFLVPLFHRMKGYTT